MEEIKKVYLSPSIQSGNIGAGDYGTEKERMNQLAKIIKDDLERHNINVRLNDNWFSTLYGIVADSNIYNPDFHVSLHSNAYDKKTRGCEVFCWEKGNHSKGEKLANNIYLKLAAITPTNDRGVKNAKNFYGEGKHIYEVFQTSSPAALIEVDFHDNPAGAKWIIENIEKIAITISKGIIKTFDIPYIEKIDNNYYYRVVAGSYKNKFNAEKQQKTLNEFNIDSFIEQVEIE